MAVTLSVLKDGVVLVWALEGVYLWLQYLILKVKKFGDVDHPDDCAAGHGLSWPGNVHTNESLCCAHAHPRTLVQVAQDAVYTVGK